MPFSLLSLLCKGEWHIITLFHIQAARFPRITFEEAVANHTQVLQIYPSWKLRYLYFIPLKMDGRKMDNFLVNIGFKGWKTNIVFSRRKWYDQPWYLPVNRPRDRTGTNLSKLEVFDVGSCWSQVNCGKFPEITIWMCIGPQKDARHSNPALEMMGFIQVTLSFQDISCIYFNWRLN